jgi:excisionase family DNA binding protein
LILCDILRTNAREKFNALRIFVVRCAILCHDLNMEQEYLTAEQVAEKLQMHPTIIRRMLAAGELPGRKLGKSWRVVASELREFMSQRPAITAKAQRVAPTAVRRRRSGD